MEFKSDQGQKNILMNTNHTHLKNNDHTWWKMIRLDKWWPLFLMNTDKSHHGWKITITSCSPSAAGILPDLIFHPCSHQTSGNIENYLNWRWSLFNIHGLWCGHTCNTIIKPLKIYSYLKDQFNLLPGQILWRLCEVRCYWWWWWWCQCGDDGDECGANVVLMMVMVVMAMVMVVLMWCWIWWW